MRATQPSDALPSAADETSPTQWLTTAEQQTWQAFLMAHRAVFAALEASLQAESGIPLTYYSILVNLSDAPGHTLRMGEIANRLYASPSSISHAMTRLESWGWINRENDPADRRAQFAVLTGDGAQALAAAAPGHVAAVRQHLLDSLTPGQMEQLRVISEAVVTGGNQRT
jgi:DNA-binding MarR family transcriptional regulator